MNHKNMNMGMKELILGLLGFIAISSSSSVSLIETDNVTPNILDVSYLNRTYFPHGFLFGTASSSYQVLAI